MNIEREGVFTLIVRLPQETDSQIRERKRWITSTDPAPEDLEQRLQLSRYFHNVRHRGCRYAHDIHRRLDLYPPNRDTNDFVTALARIR